MRNLRPCASASSTTRTTATSGPSGRSSRSLRLTPRDHDGQHVLQLAHRAERRRPPAAARGCARQHRPHLLGRRRRRGASRSGSRARSRPPTPAASCAARSSGCRTSFYLRETDLTAADAAIRAFAARRRRRRAADPLAALHRLLDGVHREVDLRHRADPRRRRPPREAFALAARRLPGPHPHLHRRRPPSRHSGPLRLGLFLPRRRRRRAGCRARLGRGEGAAISAGSASTPPTASAPATPHVRVAVGLDYLGAAPVRGSRTGGGAERLDVKLRVEQRAAQASSGAGLSGAAGRCARPSAPSAASRSGSRGRADDLLRRNPRRSRAS